MNKNLKDFIVDIKSKFEISNDKTIKKSRKQVYSNKTHDKYEDVNYSDEEPTDHELMENAYKEVYDVKNNKFKFKTKYTKRMKEYSANIKYFQTQRKIIYTFGYGWHGISGDIKQGLMENLLIKLFINSRNNKPSKKKTLNMGLYDTFLNKLRRSTVANFTDPVLERAFHKVNSVYFDNMLEIPNLKWGKESTTRVGSYDYTANQITISSALKDDSELYEYVLYHEMLHQKFGAGKTSSGRRIVHNKEFREAEHKYPNYEELEKRLSRLKPASLFGIKKRKGFRFF